MNGNQILRVVAYISIGIGIGVLVNVAWGFIAFGLLVLIDTAFLAKVLFRSGPTRGNESTLHPPQRRASTGSNVAEPSRQDLKA